MQSKFVIAVLLLWNTMAMIGQEKPIKITVVKTTNTHLFNVLNTTEMPQEVTLELTKLEGLRVSGKQKVSKIVPPGGELTFFRARVMEQKTSSSWSYSYKLPEQFLAQQARKNEQRLRALLVDSDAELNNGIVVFNKEGCPRCAYSTNYLLEQNIPFRMLNTVENPDNNKLMWDYLKANGVAKGTVTMPVILVDGKLTHSHKDLLAFLSGLE